MLKLKTKVSLLDIGVLWLICSLEWPGALRGLLQGGGGWRGGCTHSFADVSLHDPLTLLAGDVAAPVVLAVAALHQLLRVRVVASAAAHQVTAVAAQGGFVALPGERAETNKSSDLILCYSNVWVQEAKKEL